jgi:hypothetical protein
MLSGLDQGPTQFRRALFRQNAAPASLGGFNDSRVQAGSAYELAGAMKAGDVADLGQNVSCEKGTNAEDGHKRLTARVGFGKAAKLHLNLFLFAGNGVHDMEEPLNLRSGGHRQFESVYPTAPLVSEQSRPLTWPPFVEEQRMQALSLASAILRQSKPQTSLVAQLLNLCWGNPGLRQHPFGQQQHEPASI